MRVDFGTVGLASYCRLFSMTSFQPCFINFPLLLSKALVESAKLKRLENVEKTESIKARISIQEEQGNPRATII